MKELCRMSDSRTAYVQAAHAEISALQDACDSLKATLAKMHTAHAAAEREVAILKEARKHRVNTLEMKHLRALLSWCLLHKLSRHIEDNSSPYEGSACASRKCT